MLMPSGKPIFENVSSKDYYARSAELKDKQFDGCVHIVFPDFEEAVIFLEGRAVTALHESNRWLAAGEELIGPAENKAIAGEGRMSAYELPQPLLYVFIHKNVETMVETELGKYMTAGLLIGYLESGHNTCVLKLEDKPSKGYVFINFGKLSGAACDSPEGRSYGDKAVKDMGRFKEHTTANIYFMELSDKYLKSDEHAAEKPVLRVMPPEAARAIPADSVEALPAAIQLERLSIVQQPPKADVAPRLKLIVVQSDDRFVGVTHRSRQRTLEALEEHDVAWVDRSILAALRAKKAKIVLPGGSECPVTLKEAPIMPEDGKYIILPRKMRGRLSISKGMMVEVKV